MLVVRCSVQSRYPADNKSDLVLALGQPHCLKQWWDPHIFHL